MLQPFYASDDAKRAEFKAEIEKLVVERDELKEKLRYTQFYAVLALFGWCMMNIAFVVRNFSY